MLTKFEINHYKCFDDLKIDNLSQINIISGKNNVGKTALLEIISILNNSKNLRIFKENIISLFESRDLNREDINGYLENINLIVKSGSKTTHINYKTIDELTEIEIEKIDRYSSRYEEFLLMKKSNSDSDTIEILPLRREDSEHRFGLRRVILQDFFIDSSKPNNTKLTQLYSLIQDLGIQNKFLEYLQIIDPTITNIEPQIRDTETSFLRVTLKNPHRSLISSELGEGTNRFIEILCILLSNANGTVLIDEIENGIHYTKLYDIWKAIIEIVDKENIQLFVTTHDDESIKALLKASENQEFEKVTSIKLFRDEEHTVQASIKNFETLEYGIAQGADIR